MRNHGRSISDFYWSLWRISRKVLFLPLCFFRPVCDQKAVKKDNKNCFSSAQGGAVSLGCSIISNVDKNHGRWISDFYWSLWRISRKFTFRPLYLSPDVHTYGLGSVGPLPWLSILNSILETLDSLRPFYPLLLLCDYKIRLVSQISVTQGCCFHFIKADVNVQSNHSNWRLIIWFRSNYPTI